METNQFEELKKSLAAANVKLSLIERAVVGEKETGHTGLVEEVKLLKAWQRNIDLRIASFVGSGIGIGFLLRYILTGHI